MKGLRSLTIGLRMSKDHFNLYRVVDSPQDLVVVVKERLLKEIAECPGWHLIKGLQSFTFRMFGMKLHADFGNTVRLRTMPGEVEKYMAMEEKIQKIVSQMKLDEKPRVS